MENILITIFLVIFVLIAVLTLASLPGWIEIPKKSRDQLFMALLLEVFGAIIILFSQNILYKEEKPITLRAASNWVARDLDKSELTKPRVFLDSMKYDFDTDFRVYQKYTEVLSSTFRKRGYRFVCKKSGSEARYALA